MIYNFDKIIDRTNTGCIKWNPSLGENVPADVLPMWVADMDFETVPTVKERLMEVAAHGIYGYTDKTDGYYDAVIHWFGTRFNWKLQKEWIVSTTGVVMALAAAVRAYTKEGDGILIQQPVYYPFSNVIKKNNRKLVVNSLKECTDPLTGTAEKDSMVANDAVHYEMDFADLEAKIKEENVKMMILCNPHNPIGRVWKREELERVCEICENYQVQIIADEIHCDFIRPGFVHVPFGTLDCPWSKKAVICTAPSKTFNLAGLQASNIIIPDDKVRALYEEELERISIHGAGLFGLEACKTAYETGADWVDELNAYIDGNYQYIKSYIEEHLPKIKVVELQGTYLLWLDFRAYGYSDKELSDKMLQEAKIWVDDGTMFGAGGSGFMRFNLAAPRVYMEKAMKQLQEAF